MTPRAQSISPPGDELTRVSEEMGSNPMIAYGTEIPEQWWSLFNDPQLSSFIEKTLQNNPTLQAAAASVFRSSAIADTVRASLYPTLGWGGDVSRQKLSETALIPFASENSPGATPGGSGLPVPAGQIGIPVYFTQYETELALNYNFDLWGKNRNALRAALSEVQASIADEAFKRLELSIAVAQIYYQLQTDFMREEVAAELVNNKKRVFALTAQRVEGNLNDQQTATDASSKESNATQQLLQVQGDVAVQNYRLKALVAGDFQENIDPISIERSSLPQVPLPEDLPLHLIARRPDIASQLWLIESAGRQIEVAKAGFYPDINLVAFFGYQTIHLNKLFQQKSQFFNVDPAFTLPIFEGGRLRANLRASEVNYDLAIFNYNQLVIDAAKEVLEALAVLRTQEMLHTETARILSKQEELLHLSQLRLENNLNSELDYLIVQEAMLRAKDQELAAKGTMIQAMLQLIKALGGGYNSCEEQ